MREFPRGSDNFGIFVIFFDVRTLRICWEIGVSSKIFLAVMIF